MKQPDIILKVGSVDLGDLAVIRKLLQAEYEVKLEGFYIWLYKKEENDG
jgi:hypothetical protein